MLACLSEIDPISFYTPLFARSQSKVLTTSPFNLALDISQNPSPSLDLNNPVFSPQPGPHFDMLSDHIFEADLPERKTSESNILDASESLVIESLTLMREDALLEENENFY